MIDEILRIIAQWVGWIADKVIEWLYNSIEALWDWLAVAIENLYEWFAAVLDGLFDYMAGLITELTSYFATILEEISEFVAGIWESFIALVDAALTTIDEFAQLVWDSFLNLTETVLDSITGFVEDAWSTVRTAVKSLLEDAVVWIASVAEEAVRLINVGIEAVSNLAERVKNTLIRWLDDFLAKILLTYNQILEGFNIALETFLGGAESFITAIESRLSELKLAFADAATDVVAGISETAEETLGPIRDSVSDIFKDIFDFADIGEASAMLQRMRKVTAGEVNVAEIRDFLKYGFEKLIPESKFWKMVFLVMVMLAGAIPMLTQLASISGQVAVQEFARQLPYQLFTPGDVTQAWRRGLVERSYAEDTIQRQGYSAENARIVLKLSDQVPNEGDLLILFHRGLISEPELDKALHQRGYDKFYKERITKASFLIPPINDLITMAVREAFSPEVAEKFGQYEDFPEDMTAWAEKQALSEEWARRYWAAHWALPSPQQGFEMLHRGIIEQEDLDLLLRALDVMPFWRERLVQIAYTPFTRIDIRRMHRVGVLTEDDVLRSYKDLGYDEEKARVMTDFVMLLNEPKTADDEEKLKELSRSSIINFYKDGLLLRHKADSLLLGLGYSGDAARLYLDSADLDEERSERKEEISLTLALAEAGVITFEQAEDRLRNLGLETNEVRKAILSLVRKQQRKTKLPSRSEAERMLKAGIIQNREYQELLGTLGYSDKWANAYMKLAVTVA